MFRLCLKRFRILAQTHVIRDPIHTSTEASARMAIGITPVMEDARAKMMLQMNENNASFNDVTSISLYSRLSLIILLTVFSEYPYLIAKVRTLEPLYS